MVTYSSAMIVPGPARLSSGRLAGMKALRKANIAVWILTMLVSGCTSPTKPKETHLIQIACYKDSDTAGANRTLRALHQQGILFGGVGGGGYMCICVCPSEADRARKILQHALSRLSPEQRQHSLEVFDEDAKPYQFTR